MFPGSRKETKVSDKVRFDKLSYWIGKAKQQRCADVEKQHYLDDDWAYYNTTTPTCRSIAKDFFDLSTPTL